VKFRHQIFEMYQLTADIGKRGVPERGLEILNGVDLTGNMGISRRISFRGRATPVAVRYRNRANPDSSATMPMTLAIGFNCRHLSSTAARLKGHMLLGDLAGTASG
jgi:hypothetical protein